jgi:hypothetical protein
MKSIPARLLLIVPSLDKLDDLIQAFDHVLAFFEVKASSFVKLFNPNFT